MMPPASQPIKSAVSGKRYKLSPSVLAKTAFLAIAIAAGWYAIRSDIGAVWAALGNTNIAVLIAALLASALNIALTAVSWRLLLEEHPQRPAWLASAKVFFAGQLGKYVPGTIWSFLATGQLAQKEGLDRKTAVASLLLATIIGLGTGMLISAIAMLFSLTDAAASWSAFVIIPAILAALCFAVFRSPLLEWAGVEFPINARALLFSVATAVLAWAAAGLQIYLIYLSLGETPGLAFAAQAAAIYAAAWCAGFAVFLAPAGLGAREGTMAALLAATIPLADAVAIALLSRITMTLADFLLGGSFLFASPAKSGPRR